MKLSIITINYNNSLGLQITLNSIKNQTNQGFEYIVIDGGSTDGSVDIIKQYSDTINFWVSEKDSGIYNAMNKGIKTATGEYILFLNSGDKLNDENVISNVLGELNSEISIYYGNLYFNNKGEKTILWTPPDKLSFSYFLLNSLAHQASFIKRELFYKYFFYNEKLKIVSDWEFFIYCICKENEPYKHIDAIITDFDDSGISNNKENLNILISENKLVLEKHFPLFIEDIKIIKEFQTKRFQQILYIRNNRNKWKLLKFFINIILIFKRDKINTPSYFKQL